MEKTLEELKELIEIKKKSSSVYLLDFKDKDVYAKIDSIMSLFGDISKYSEIMNNILAENILERVVTEKFISVYGKQENIF